MCSEPAAKTQRTGRRKKATKANIFPPRVAVSEGRTTMMAISNGNEESREEKGLRTRQSHSNSPKSEVLSDEGAPGFARLFTLNTKSNFRQELNPYLTHKRQRELEGSRERRRERYGASRRFISQRSRAGLRSSAPPELTCTRWPPCALTNNKATCRTTKPKRDPSSQRKALRSLGMTVQKQMQQLTKGNSNWGEPNGSSRDAIYFLARERM